MKRIFCLILFFTCLYPGVSAQRDTILQRIVLIGDGGELTGDIHPVVDAVRKTIKLDDKTIVLYLGDNLYKIGLPDDQTAGFNTVRAVLDTQLSVADGTPSKVYMIPGNHDWNNGGRDGYAAIIREQVYVDFLGKPNVKFYPEDGCPGPVEVSLGSDVTLVIFDSQWWIHPYDKPGIESDCEFKTKEELVTQIEEILNRNSKKLVVLACHHPFKSNGVHGGFFPLKKHIFPFTDINENLYIPLPIIGSIYPIARSVFGTPQDIPHPNYTNMINQITSVAKTHPNLVFVAGHDHGLQLIEDSNHHYIVSGGGCKVQRVSSSRRAPYVEKATGFAVMEVSVNKNVTVDFYTVSDSIRHRFNETILNFSKIPEEKIDSSKREVDDPFVKYKDTFSFSASEKYPPVHGLRRLIMGKNYRSEWSTPVNMKVFNISTIKGGMRILSLGGGKQTKSLRLVDKSGKEWVLRSVDKNPTRALPEEFRGTLAQDVVQEFNSASHPYGALSVYPLARAVDVVAPNPDLYFVPDDPSLGFYRPLFANTVCMLEERHASEDGSETRSTAKVFEKIIDENDHRADQEATLRARLLDILVADFDRHFDQWRWATNDTGKGKLYYPIPRDRDQAFFYSDGLLMKLANRNILPFLRGFRHDIPEVNWLGYSAKDFDRLFLTDLDAHEWTNAISDFQKSINDSVITEAVKKLPPEIFELNGDKIIEKLKSRRDQLSRAGMQYYRFISKHVNVIGSNQKEYFKVSNYKDGLHVRVYAREGRKDTSFLMYERTFEPSTTREIRLYGLNGDDLFDIDESAKSRIRIRIVGGKGNDTFDVKGNVPSQLYDMNVEGNYIKNMRKAKNRFSKDAPVNSISIIGFRYNENNFPQLEFGVNSDDGLLVGGGFSRKTYGFRNEPYATFQKLSALYSVTRGSYKFRYEGEFNHVYRDFDFLFRGEFGYPRISNFFGLGNNTKLPASPDYGFYLSRYRTIELQALIRRRYFERLHISVGPYLQYYWNDLKDNNSRILGKPSLAGLDSLDVYSRKAYMGGKAVLQFDNTNSTIFPTRGVMWYNELVSVAGLTTTSDYYTRIRSDMTIYASLSDPARLVAVVGLGGGKILSDSFEFFQAMSLGVGNNIHGFRKNRYLGKSSLYSSIELRFKLFDLNSYVFPGPVGLTGFYDIGRVWMPNESSNRWHSAYGGGLYFIPFNMFRITASVGFSGKEHLYNITFGSNVNLTF